MLNVIDVSSNNPGVNTGTCPGAEAVIVKATQGAGYTNPLLSTQVSRARAAGRMVGLYHFATPSNSPSTDFAHFWSVARNHWKAGDVLVLDYEPTTAPSNSAAWVLQWAEACHAASGVWPWIYSYAGLIRSFDFSATAKNCALWIAGGNYYTSQLSFNKNLGAHPSVASYWNVAAWQYSEVGRPGGSAQVDLSVFYGTTQTWQAYGGLTSTSTAGTSVTTTAPTSVGAVVTTTTSTKGTTVTEAEIEKIATRAAAKTVQALLGQKLGRSGPDVATALQESAQAASITKKKG